MLMLLFYCGRDCFAFPCESVIEVFPKVHIQNIPGSGDVRPDYVVGLFNFGGSPIPVIDLCQCIEKRSCSSSMHSRLILLQHPTEIQQRVALMAEKVTETQDLDPQQFLDSGLHLKGLPFLKGVYSEGEKAIQYFDVGAFFKTITI